MYHDRLIIAIPFFLILFELDSDVLYETGLLILVTELYCVLSRDIPDRR